MSLSLSLSDLDPSKKRDLEKMHELLGGAQTKLTFWGERKIIHKQYEGSISFGELSALIEKVNKNAKDAFFERNRWGDEKDGLRVKLGQKAHLLFDESRYQAKSLSPFSLTRLFLLFRPVDYRYPTISDKQRVIIVDQRLEADNQQVSEEPVLASTPPNEYVLFQTELEHLNLWVDTVNQETRKTRTVHKRRGTVPETQKRPGTSLPVRGQYEKKESWKS